VWAGAMTGASSALAQTPRRAEPYSPLTMVSAEACAAPPDSKVKISLRTYTGRLARFLHKERCFLMVMTYGSRVGGVLHKEDACLH